MTIKLKIGTRGSKLALTQCGWVQRQIVAALGDDPARADEIAPLTVITTTGDRIQDRRLIEAYIHDLDRKRQARLKALRAKYGDDDSIAELRAYVEPTAAPAEPAPAPASDYTPPPARDPFDTATVPVASSSSDPEPTTREN